MIEDYYNDNDKYEKTEYKLNDDQDNTNIEDEVPINCAQQ